MRSFKFIIVLINLAIVITILLNVELWLDWVKDEKGSLLTDFSSTVLLAAIPGIPFGMVSGIIGAKYGVLVGGMMCLIASTLAAAFVYFLFRFLFQEQGARLLERYVSFRRMDQFLKRHAFWSILIARIIPIMPAAMINIYAGVFRLPFKTFLLSSFLGKIPIMFTFTLMGDSLNAGTQAWMFVLLFYALFLLIAYGVYSKLKNF